MASLTQEKSSLKILHLYSDWRWTGPAEPVLQICKGLKERGHRVILAFRSPPVKTENITIEQMVQRNKIQGLTSFSLDRYIGPLNTIKDLIRIPAYMKREGFDIVHMHLSHDHAMGTLCARLLGKKRPFLVRTFHKKSLPKKNIFNKLLFRYTDGYLFFTEGFRKRYIELFGLDPEKTGLQYMTLDLKRFDPEKGYKDMRKEFDIPEEAIVIGIVGRFQRYRRMNWFLKAAKEIISREKKVYFLIIGRSSQMRNTVIEPINRLGIKDRAIIAGYRREDYVDTLACLDIFTLLMPGSDGTARALREAMAMQKACVVSDYGMLPEIVDNGRAGIIVKDIASLTDAWRRLIQFPDLRERLGRAARRYALNMFDINRASQALEEFYYLSLRKKDGII